MISEEQRIAALEAVSRQQTVQIDDQEGRIVRLENDVRLAKIGLVAVRWAVGIGIGTAIIVLLERALA